MFNSRCDFKLVFLPWQSSRTCSKASKAHWLGTKNRQICPRSSLERQGHQLGSADGEGHWLSSMLERCCKQGCRMGYVASIPSFPVRLPGQVELRAIFSSMHSYEFASLPRWGCKTGLYLWFIGCGPDRAELHTKLPGQTKQFTSAHTE